MNPSKMINKSDVEKLYKSMYRIQFKWEHILPSNIYNYMECLSVSKGCPIPLQMAALLPLFAMACGPKTHLRTTRMDCPSNLFLIGVSDPGGGKTAVTTHIIDPCLDMLSSSKYLDMSPQIEVYTTAGLQEHQQKSKGYGIITSSEGHRVIQSINSKVNKGEGERALLCKLWDGGGDRTCSLAGKNRGFTCTSMSMSLFIQPEMLYNELLQMVANDGFLDRLLFVATRPYHYLSKDVDRASSKLIKNFPVAVFPKAIAFTFEQHNVEADDTIDYKYDVQAKQFIDEMDDNFAELLNARYASSDDNDKNDDETVTQVLDRRDEQGSFYTSKDSMHISRLSLVLHVFFTNVGAILKGIQRPPKLKVTISKDIVERASNLFYVMSNQKTLMLQGIHSTKQLSSVAMTIGKSNTEKIKYQICRSKGPLVVIRDIQRNTGTLTAAQIKHELKQIQENGDGAFVEKKSQQWCKFDVYFKPVPDSLSENGHFLSGILTLNDYTRNFCNTTSMPPRCKQIVKYHPCKEAFPVALSQFSEEFSTEECESDQILSNQSPSISQSSLSQASSQPLLSQHSVFSDFSDSSLTSAQKPRKRKSNKICVFKKKRAM